MKERLQRLKRLLFAQGGLPIVWIVLTVMVLIPVWRQRLLPMLDTPNHLALVRAWHSFNDPTYKIADYYTLRVRPVPYILFYLTIHLLMYVVNIEIANKIFLSIYLILFPLSILALARALKRSPWLALGGFALAFSQNWTYGFSSYLMGTCFMFFSLAFLIRFMDEGRRRWAVLLGLCTVLTYFGHIMTWFCFGLLAITLLVLHWKKWRRGMIASAVMLPSVSLALIAWVEERGERTFMKTGDGLGGSWRDFPTAVMEFPRRVMELFPGNLDMWVLGTIAATVLGLAIWQGTRVRGEGEAEQQRIKWMLIVLGITYLALPYAITRPMSWWYVSPRLPAMMAPLILLLPAATISGRQRLLMLPMVIACIVLPLKLTKLYRDFSARNIPFMRLVSELPRGSKTLVVVRGMMRGAGSEEKSGDPATSAPVYWHFSSWPMAIHGGYSPYVFDQGIPVRPKVTLQAPNNFIPDTFDIRQAPEFDYYLVRLPTELMDREPSIKMVSEMGEWKLYQRMFKLTDEP
jgi:hypothetical protein